MATGQRQLLPWLQRIEFWIKAQTKVKLSLLRIRGLENSSQKLEVALEQRKYESDDLRFKASLTGPWPQ